ncbi:hypothetical protein [Pseudomonas leptonychotis]|uniref:hypothetical protein n=1 Tax=Pseudomonas leptonychotis TaxID=2448482 RepID=UPI00386EFDCE
MIALAKFLDSLHLKGEGYVNESEINVSVSDVGFENVKKIIVHLECLLFSYAVADSEGNEWSKGELALELQPFRISFNKPHAGYSCIRLLTLEGFRQYLGAGHDESRWEISYLEKPFLTKSRVFTPWNDGFEFFPQVYRKNPRTLVRDYSSSSLVPADIGLWLLDGKVCDFENPVFEIWASKSIQKLVSTLPNEIDEVGEVLKFNGPPRLKLRFPVNEEGLFLELTKSYFLELQVAVSWVFENDREAESKQILLSAEVARSSSKEESALYFIKEHISAALAGAKIAYALAISEVSRDALKSLADLRKAVTEETAKLTDTTRQVAAAVAGSFAVGLGLLAAKAATQTQAWLLITLSIVAALYVAAVIASGVHFLFLQRSLRSEWYSRLYRFLPEAEYNRMVTLPTRSTERLFIGTAAIGAIIIIMLTISVIYFSVGSSEKNVKHGVPIIIAQQSSFTSDAGGFC